MTHSARTMPSSVKQCRGYDAKLPKEGTPTASTARLRSSSDAEGSDMSPDDEPRRQKGRGDEGLMKALKIIREKTFVEHSTMYPVVEVGRLQLGPQAPGGIQPRTSCFVRHARVGMGEEVLEISE